MNFMKRTEQLKRVTEVASSCPVEQIFLLLLFLVTVHPS